MKDLLLTNNMDLEIAGGDFVIGDSDMQNQKGLLLAEKGAFKQYPQRGVGVEKFINDDNANDLLREIRLEFSADGMSVSKLGLEDGKIKVTAKYGN